mgnify:CR=1 FL=1
MKMRWEIHRSCIHPSRFQSLFLAANREMFPFWGITQNLDPLYDVLVEPLGYDALLLEYHGMEYPDPPEAPEKAISAFRTVKENSDVLHRSESPPRKGGGLRSSFSCLN